MLRYVWFPEKSTAEIRDKLNAAGDGAILRIVPRAGDDGGIHLLIDVVGGNTNKGVTAECDDPTNDAHVCPPQC